MLMMETSKSQSFTDWLKERKKLLEIEFDKDLATRLGILPETLSNIFALKRSPTASHIENIIVKLGIERGSPEYFELLELAHKNRLEMETSQPRNRGKE